MSLLKRLVVPFALFSLAALVGCGSNSNSVTPPPSGAYSNTSLNGTYAFSVSGSDINGPFTMAGSLTACGCSQGTISGGNVDFDDPSTFAPGSTIGNNSIYQIGADGRGKAKLFITTSASVALPEVDVDFVLTSSSHGLIIRYDQGGTGSGTLDLQSGAISQSSLANTYSFSLSGSDPAGNPLSTVGAFTLNSSGGITAGVQDFNYDKTPYTALALSGSVLVGTGTAPGTASLTTSFSATPLTFDVYAIDATHLKVIESDSLAILVGDVFTQGTPSIPQGNLVFTMSGLDSSANLFAAGGLMASDGTSQITSGAEDVNDDGIVDGGANPATPLSFSGSFSATGGGRFLVALSGFAGGANFVAYPSTGGIFWLEVDSGLGAGVTGGIALVQQSGAGISASQGYGLNVTGEDVINLVELDEIAEFKTSSTSVTGLLDENDGGALGTSNVSGSYTAGSNGSGSASLGRNLQGIFYYAADSSTALFISTDPNQAASGSFQVQTAPAQSALAQPRALPMLRVLPHAHSAKGRTKTLIGPAK